MTDVKYPIWDVRTAANLATAMHNGQVDKAGMEYIYHPQRVAEKVMAVPKFAWMTEADQKIAVMTAWLHDVLEDTTMTLATLGSLGCPPEVCDHVWRLTRGPRGTRPLYYASIRNNPIALMVKTADIADNTDPARLAKLDEATRTRLIGKYAKAKLALGLADIIR